MEKKIIENKRTGEKYIQIDHPSGLRICVWPMEGYSTTHALFGTRYGSVNTHFKTKEEKDFISVPNGIAHYLEHKLFENEDCNVFSLYAETGASANAYTGFDRTCYLFSCTDNFEPSLEILLDFVQKPYFTAENVAKEQGIIGQEIRMYDDNPNWQVFFNMLRGLYFNHPVKIDIAGTVESIAQINADLLYKCYNAFYNLHNMVLSIAGNVDVDRIIEICDRLLKPNDDMNLEITFPDEPDEVTEKIIRRKMPVSMPLFNIGYKSRAYTGLEAVRAEVETNMVLMLLADESTDFYKKLYDGGYITPGFSSEVFSGNGYFVSIFGGESRQPEKVLELINEEVELRKKIGFDRELFDNVKKSYYGSLIRDLNDPETLATSMLNSTMDGVDAFAVLDAVAAVTPEDLIERLKIQFNTENATLSIIEPQD